VKRNYCCFSLLNEVVWGSGNCRLNTLLITIIIIIIIIIIIAITNIIVIIVIFIVSKALDN